MATNEMAEALAREALDELARAQAKHGPMRSGHEGYAVLKEEVDELWDAIKANDSAAARREAVQVAAMALRYLLDVGPAKTSRASGPPCGPALDAMRTLHPGIDL